jgi:hypothetical protein
MDRRSGCLSGIVKLLLLDWLFNWAERRFGFGRGLSCSGCGCGVILLLIFAALACSVLTGTNWGHLSLNTLPLAF